MRTFLHALVISLFIITGTLQSQNFTWVDGIETGYSLNPNMVRYTVAACPDGSIWFVGMKEQVTSYNDMMGDQFVIRYDTDGNKLEEHLIDGALIVNAIETDDDGNLYLGGDFYPEDVTFWDGTTLEWENSTLNGFLAKTEPGGILDWAMSSSEYTGSYAGIRALKYKNGTMYMSHGSWPDSKISKVDGDGYLTEFIIQDGVGIASGLDLDSEGNLYVTGSCSGQTALFNGVNYESPFPYNKHLVKYNPDGEPQWVLFSEDVTCIFPSVQVDGDDFLYWSGNLYTSCLIDTIPLVGADWVFDFFVARLNSDGQVQWAREVPEGLAGDAGTGRDHFLQVLPDNSVTFAGFLRGTIDWGNGVVSSSDIPGNNILIVNFSSDGTAQWAKNTTGDSYSLAQAITSDPSGNLYLTAISHDTTILDDLEVYQETYYYPLIAKLETGMATGIATRGPVTEDLKFYPNPAKGSITFTNIAGNIDLLEVYSYGSAKVWEAKSVSNVDLEGFAAGMYFLKAHMNDGRVAVAKLIVSE